MTPSSEAPLNESAPARANGATRLRDLMTTGSRMRYAAWRTLNLPSPITVSLRSGERLVLRAEPAKDLSVAYEVFVEELYRSPQPLDTRAVRRIVDVGANVGYSVIYFARRFPRARFEAFEPHPEHLRLIAANLAVNDLHDRINVYPAAAGIAPARAWLVDAGASSYVTAESGAGRIRIDVVDFFTTLDHGHIDLLKMDCEGGEHALLMDPRFARLDVAALVMEWHATPELPDADGILSARLQTLGWSVRHQASHELNGMPFGMIWAYR